MSRKLAIGIASIFVLLFLAAYEGGCSSRQQAARLSEDERRLIEASKFALTVGITGPDRDAPWHLAAVQALRSTGLFAKIDYLDRLPGRPDLIAEGTRISGGTAAIPILTLISLGVLPTFIEERWGFAFTFTSPGPSGDKLDIEAVQRGKSCLGLTCAAYSKLKPDEWADVDPDLDQRMYDRLALEIARQADAIRRLQAR